MFCPLPPLARRRVCGVLIYATARNHGDHGNPSFEITHKRSCNVTMAKQSLTQSHKGGHIIIIIMLKLQVNKLN
jgi:hypothetical protein